MDFEGEADVGAPAEGVGDFIDALADGEGVPALGIGAGKEDVEIALVDECGAHWEGDFAGGKAGGGEGGCCGEEKLAAGSGAHLSI